MRHISRLPRSGRQSYRAARLRHEEKDRQVRDVVPNDLGATLEAHRESNLRARIRPVMSPRDHPPETGIKIPKSTPPRAPLYQSSLQAEALSVKPVRKVIVREQERRAFDENVDIEGHPSQGHRPGHERLVKMSRLSKKASAAAQASGSYIHPFDKSNTRWNIRSWDFFENDADEESLRFAPYLDNIASELHPNRPEVLDQTIIQLDSWTRVTREELMVRKSLTSEIISYLQVAFPELSFDVFGSSRSGLMIPSSDIDISMNLRAPGGTNSEPLGSTRAATTVRRMKKMLQKNKDFQISHIVPRGRAPLVSLEHKRTQLKVQVVATSNGGRVLPYIETYLDEFAQIRPLFTLVKLCLQARQLHEPGQGGVGAYTLFIMMVTYFKTSSGSKHDALSGNLIRFFDFYANLDTSTWCIAADPPALFRKRDPSSRPSKEDLQAMQNDLILAWQSKLCTTNKTRPYLLCLQDPSEPSNDLGMRSHRIMDIRQTFAQLAAMLKCWLADDSEVSRSDRSEPAQAPSLDPLQPLLGDVLDIMRARRRRLQRARSSSKSGSWLPDSGTTQLSRPSQKFQTLNAEKTRSQRERGSRTFGNESKEIQGRRSVCAKSSGQGKDEKMRVPERARAEEI